MIFNCFYNFLFIEYEYIINFEKNSVFVLIWNGGCNLFFNIFFFNMGVNELNIINVLFFLIF